MTRRPLPTALLLALALATGVSAPAPGAEPAAVTAPAATVIDPALFEEDQRGPDARFSYKTVAGVDLPMAVFLPPDRTSPTERRPVVLCIHGGAWSAWKGGDCTTWDGGLFAPHARLFSARGAVAVTISYRHKPLPGKEPEKMAALEAGPSLADLISDTRSAVRWLRRNADRFGIDPARIAVIGDSAGGHLAAALGTIDRFDEPGEDTRISARADLVIACNPITDLTDPRWLPFVHTTPRPWEGATPLSHEDRAKAQSPLWNVSAASAPTLAIHGLKDGTVEPRHAEAYVQALQKAGVRSELVLLPESSHAFILFGYRATGRELLGVLGTIDRFLVTSGWLTGSVAFQAAAVPGLRGTIAGDRIEGGRVVGSDGLALAIDPTAGSTSATVVQDPDRGPVLQVGKGKGGLALTGAGVLGTTARVALAVRPGKGAATLVRRSHGGNPATGYRLSIGRKGEILWQVAGATLTGPALPVEAWSRVEATVSPDRATLSVDGVLVAEQALTGALLIGRQVVVAEGFVGRLADLHFGER